MQYCCNNFEYYIKKGIELEYEAITRSYHMRLEDDEHMCTRQEIYYCPWCGSKLPTNLNMTWSSVLREEYGIRDPILHEYEDGSTVGGTQPVPPEFKTDEWWKKRGL